MSPQEAPKDSVCTRCRGEGILEHYSHVVGGICFRCWGSGVDPKTAKQLEVWLAKAREEYRVRKAALKGETGPWADPRCTGARLEREMKLIEKLGKENKARLVALEADVRFGKALAKDKARRMN